MNKAYKFRLYPSKEQGILLGKTFGCCRFIYNRMLSDKIEHYERTGENLYCYPSQYKDDFPWLREVDSLALVGAYNALSAAYKNFFRDKGAGFPKFKSKHRSRKSYTTNLLNGNIELADGMLKLPKLGRIKVVQHREIPEGYRMKSVTVSQAPSGKYYASILYAYDAQVAPVEPVSILGLDFSMKELYVSSEGESPSYPRFYRQSMERMAREQRKLSRREKGGKNRGKQRRKVARLHEHIANQRLEFLHKQSRQIANAYDAVCIEDLNMKGMSQALNLGKSVADNGWGKFVGMMEYKLAEQGKKLVKVDKWFPSSKMCSRCGAIKDEMPLSERVFHCGCGFVSDRDENSAINIRNEGSRQLA